jgi:hypothetical protein
VRGPIGRSAIDFEGPRYESGQVEIGWSADRPVAVEVVGEWGQVKHGLVCGDEGMGRSGVLQQVALGALASRAFGVLSCNGQDDRTSALSRFATGTVHQQLAALEEFSELRFVQRRGTTQYSKPSPERPGVLWLVEGLDRHLCADRDFAQRVGRLLRRAHRNGIGVWGITPGMRLWADFGGVGSVWAALSGSTCVAFPARTAAPEPLPTGVRLDASVLPYEPGRALVATQDGVASILAERMDNAAPWIEAAQQVAWDDEAGELFARHGLKP